MSVFDSFILFWPKSDISPDYAIDILRLWGADYELNEVTIPNSIEFFVDLYGIDNKLAQNKLNVCGSGKAILIKYKSPLDVVRYRATFTQIKLCNVFSFDLKFLLRLRDGANRIHGSTDYEEYKNDLRYFEVALAKEYDEEVTRKVLKTSLIRTAKTLVGKLKKVFVRVINRFRFVGQIVGRNVDFIYCYLRLNFPKKENIVPTMRKKWRWGARYFLKDNKFVKTPNRFESSEAEAELTRKLFKIGIAPSVAETTLVLGRESLEYDFVEIKNPKAKFFKSNSGVIIAAELLKKLNRFQIVHRDLKIDNLHLTSDYTLQVIDMGLSFDLSELKTVKNERVAGKPVERWNDGVVLLALIFENFGLDVLADKVAYTNIASEAGTYAVLGNIKYVP